MARIFINGFGRIGRTVLRAWASGKWPEIEIVGINDIAAGDLCAHLFVYDSVFGPYQGQADFADGTFILNGNSIPFHRTDDVSTLDLTDVDLLLECTGKADSPDIANRGLRAGAGRILISGPSGAAALTMVLGANDHLLNDQKIVSNASCTTNALAPLVKLLDDAWGIHTGWMTTIHCYTGSQPMVDAPRGDLARSRAGAESIVPTTTSAASELAKVLPVVAKRTTVAAVRVPSLSVSSIDATIQLDSPIGASATEMLQVIADRSSVIGSTNDPCVSRDLRARPESLVLALPETMVLGDTQLRVFGWYDNEWGFSARMIEMARILSARPNEKEGAHGTR